MEFLVHYRHFASHKVVIRDTVFVVITSCELDTFEIRVPGDNEIQLVAVR